MTITNLRLSSRMTIELEESIEKSRLDSLDQFRLLEFRVSKLEAMLTTDERVATHNSREDGGDQSTID